MDDPLSEVLKVAAEEQQQNALRLSSCQAYFCSFCHVSKLIRFIYLIQLPLSFHMLLLTFYGICLFNGCAKPLRCNNVTFYSLKV